MQRPLEGRCTYHPCRNFGRTVRLDGAFLCLHREHCPFFEPPRAAQRARVALAIAGAMATMLVVVFALTLRPFERSLPPRLPGDGERADADRAVPAYDYAREIEELVAFSDAVLAKTDAIRVFEQQLANDAVPLPAETVDRWLSAVERKRSERNELCIRMVEKLGLLIRLNHWAVDHAFARIETDAAGVDGGRRRKSASLAREQWDLVKRTGNLRHEDLIARAETLVTMAPF